MITGGTPEFEKYAEQVARAQYVGKAWRLSGLESERGRALNGKVCDCIGLTSCETTSGSGMFSCRLNVVVRLNDVGDANKAASPTAKSKAIKVKISNIIKVDSDSQDQQHGDAPQLGAKKRARVIELAEHQMHQTRSEAGGQTDRPDWVHRSAMMEQCLQAFKQGATLPLRCGDMGTEAQRIIDGSVTHANAGMLRMIAGAKPGCVGDGYFRLEETPRGGVEEHRVMSRFGEYMLSGLCVSCQQRLLETEDD
jgi:hypothetical protein